MKTNFKFDKKTGTMVADGEKKTEAVEKQPDYDVRELRRDEVKKPEMTEEKKMEIRSDSPNVLQNNVLQMKRVDKQTPVQLVGDSGLPEAYLDSVTTGVLMFRDKQDYDIYQIVDERSNKPLVYIGGYALQINFNMAELKTPERVEQCLAGITKLFRRFIMEQALNR